ncbi:MAG: DUF4271 domain-containing protein [Prevotella sp.]|nr:DUF4271 domain-containing protein [Prevotella sp.]
MTFLQVDSTEVADSHNLEEPTVGERQTDVVQQQNIVPITSKPVRNHIKKDTLQTYTFTEEKGQENESDTDSLQLYEEAITECEDSDELPLYYKENYFFSDSLLYSKGTRALNGISGNPLPYTIRNDNMITSILLVCFILVLIGLSKTGRLIARQTKGFFNEHRKHTAEYTETTNEYRFQFFLVLQSCLLFALLSFIYTQQFADTTFFIMPIYLQLTIFFAVFVAYFSIKTLLYWVVNSVFFDKSSNMVWLKSLLFITSVEGIALFPLVVILSYINLPIIYGTFYLCFVIIIVKILLFYKCFVTFFRQKVFCLQIILYFCALEIIPLLFLWGTLVKIIDCFKINI